MNPNQYLQQLATSGNLSIPNLQGNNNEKTQNMYTYNNNINLFTNSLYANPNSLGNQNQIYSFNYNNSMKNSGLNMNKDFASGCSDHSNENQA